MALVLKDRVRETSTTTGTGTFTLAGAVAGFQSFSAIGTGNSTYYTIVSTSDWEVGIGTWTSPDQLSRDTVLASTNAGALVTFGSGTKDVFLTFPAEGFAVPPAIGGTTPNDVTATNLTVNTEQVFNPVTPGNIGTAHQVMIDGDGTYDVLDIYMEDEFAAKYPVRFSGGINTYPLYLLSPDYATNYQYIALQPPSGMSTFYTLTLPATAGSNNQVLKTDGTGNLSWATQGVQGTAPVTVTAANYTVAATDQWIIGNRAGTITLTLPTASTNTGRSLTVKTIQSTQTVVSASSNVVPLAGGAAGTAILGTLPPAGKFATLVSDGTNWIIMQSN